MEGKYINVILGLIFLKVTSEEYKVLRNLEVAEAGGSGVRGDLCSLLPWVFFFFFWPCHAACDLSSLTGARTGAPALEVRSPNHWTAREVALTPRFEFLPHHLPAAPSVPLPSLTQWIFQSFDGRQESVSACGVHTADRPRVKAQSV